jgi:hypothetical protein
MMTYGCFEIQCHSYTLCSQIEKCPLQMRGQTTLLKEAQKCICGFHKVTSISLVQVVYIDRCVCNINVSKITLGRLYNIMCLVYLYACITGSSTSYIGCITEHPCPKHILCQ